MQDHRITAAWELPAPAYALHRDVSARLGPIAAVSLECVLLDGAKRFMALSTGEIAFIRDLANVHRVTLPI